MGGLILVWWSGLVLALLGLDKVDGYDGLVGSSSRLTSDYHLA